MEKSVEIQEVSAVSRGWGLLCTRKQVLQRRLFYALSGFNHDANFVPSLYSDLKEATTCWSPHASHRRVVVRAGIELLQSNFLYGNLNLLDA